MQLRSRNNGNDAHRQIGGSVKPGFSLTARPLPGIQDCYNRKGLISDHGQEKKASYVMQNYNRELQKETQI